MQLEWEGLLALAGRVRAGLRVCQHRQRRHQRLTIRGDRPLGHGAHRRKPRMDREAMSDPRVHRCRETRGRGLDQRDSGEAGAVSSRG